MKCCRCGREGDDVVDKMHFNKIGLYLLSECADSLACFRRSESQIKEQRGVTQG